MLTTHRSDIAKHPKAAAPTRPRVEPRQSYLPHSWKPAAV